MPNFHHLPHSVVQSHYLAHGSFAAGWKNSVLASVAGTRLKRNEILLLKNSNASTSDKHINWHDVKQLQTIETGLRSIKISSSFWCRLFCFSIQFCEQKSRKLLKVIKSENINKRRISMSMSRSSSNLVFEINGLRIFNQNWYRTTLQILICVLRAFAAKEFDHREVLNWTLFPAFLTPSNTFDKRYRVELFAENR